MGTGDNVQHTYAASGTYTVTLNVTDNDGHTGSASETLMVEGPPPTAAFTSNMTYAKASFNGGGSTDPDGTITNYAWEFGDGVTGAGVTTQHSYTTSGTYTVTLTVTDNDGHTATITHDVSATVAPPPTAAFTSSATYLKASFDGTSSGDVDGTITGYAWDFGDSTNGTGATPQHTYATGGTYTVGLTVTDDDGHTATVTHDVTVTTAPPPTAAFTSNMTYLKGSFDGTGSTDVDGTITSYAWNFGDSATDTGATPQHTYATGGTYTVVLTVTDNEGHTATVTHDVTATVAPPPTAAFTSSSTYRTASFDANGSGDVDGTIAGYAWDFGDSTSGSGATPQHTYATAGTYTVALTVTDNEGHTGAITHDVTVADPPPPTAAFTSTSTYLKASFDSNGSGDVDGTITGYAWNFGDGATGTGPTPQHTYATAGTYTVTLTVTDNDGHTGVVTHDVTVVNAPPPTASFTSSATNLTASFDGTGSGDVDGTITGYAWNFGDGATGTGPTPQRIYATGGTYTVTLTVTDNDGHTGVTTGQVTVFNPAVQYASDTFTRTVANGLGTADFGGPWTLAGTASGFSVAGGVGRMTGAVAANRAGYLAGVRQTEIDMTTDLAPDQRVDGRWCLHLGDRPAHLERQRLSPQAAIHARRVGHRVPRPHPRRRRNHPGDRDGQRPERESRRHSAYSIRRHRHDHHDGESKGLAAERSRAAELAPHQHQRGAGGAANSG